MKVVKSAREKEVLSISEIAHTMTPDILAGDPRMSRNQKHYIF